MNIIGCDLHTRYQVIAWMNEEAGEIVTRRLEHEKGEAHAFYASLPAGATVGIEATFPALWFERMLGQRGHQLWVGDAAEIRARAVRARKTDTRDAEHLLSLLRTGRFPRIWVPSLAERDLRQLLAHRNKVARMRTAVKNQLQAMALSQGLYRRRKLWSSGGRTELEGLELLPWAGRRRQELLEWLKRLNASVRELDRAVEQAAAGRVEVARLETHPGVGTVVSLAFVLTLGPVERFGSSKQLVSYLGLNPREHSSGGRQRLGSISKQGNSMMRWPRVEAAQTAARFDPELRHASGVAKVAIARKLAVRLYWMLRNQTDYAQLVRTSGSPSSAVVDRGPSEL